MKVHDRKLIADFIRQHARSKIKLEAWLTEVEEANWRTPADIKERYPRASILSDNRVIFNIAGNNYRLLVQVAFKSQIIAILKVGTHAEYNKWVL